MVPSNTIQFCKLYALHPSVNFRMKVVHPYSLINVLTFTHA